MTGGFPDLPLEAYSCLLNELLHPIVALCYFI
jgi:hypothetical protein